MFFYWMTIANKKIVRYCDDSSKELPPLLHDEKAIVKLTQSEYALVNACNGNLDKAREDLDRLVILCNLAENLQKENRRK